MVNGKDGKPTRVSATGKYVAIMEKMFSHLPAEPVLALQMQMNTLATCEPFAKKHLVSKMKQNRTATAHLL